MAPPIGLRAQSAGMQVLSTDPSNSGPHLRGQVGQSTGGEGGWRDPGLLNPLLRRSDC